MENELKLCPCCGSRPLMVEIGNDATKKREVIIKCTGCRVQRRDGAIHYNMDWLKKLAIQKWNERI